MKKILFFTCLLGALVSCNQESVELSENVSDYAVVNDAVEGSVPLKFRIFGESPQTKGLASLATESTLINVKLYMDGYDYNNRSLFSEVIDLGTQTDGILNVRKCSKISLKVCCGNVDEEGYLTSLEGQSDYFYAEGSVVLDWATIEAQKTPLDIVLARKINKITIEKISVNWINPNYDTKEFRIKNIFLCDIPRTYVKNQSTDCVSIYRSDYSKTKESLKYYNMGGLDGYSYYDSSTDTYFDAVTERLDGQLLDVVDVVVSKDDPYDTPHIFYTYINNSSYQLPQVRNESDKSNGVISLYPAMSTIVVEAEMEGNSMYYRFQIMQPGTGVSPTNTHIRFKELVITDLGAPSIYEAKTYRNVAYSCADWIDMSVDEQQESL